MLTIVLKDEVETRLNTLAKGQGLEPATYAAELIEHSLPNQATLDLLAQWNREDATDDSEEIVRRQKEAEEFMRSLARSRVEMEGPNARKLWP
jgi:predicted DNA-binding protein